MTLLGLAELLCMSVWLVTGAITPELEALWGLTTEQAGWLTTVVQLGFVTGTAMAAVLNLADIFSARLYLSASALLAAACNAGLLLEVGFEGALVLRFGTGLFLAGVYPPAMKMISTWFRSSRGFAIGTIVGALTVGKASPYLVKVLLDVDVQGVLLSTSAGAMAAGVLVLFTYRDGPYPFPKTSFSLSLISRVIRDRQTRLATGGYLGHMWELYPMWSLIGLFFLDYFSGILGDGPRAALFAGLSAFGVIGLGGVGAVWAGVWADRLGRERITIIAMAISGVCALLMGWLITAPVLLVLLVGGVWGFFIVADSAQFSAVVTEVAPQDAVGTALTLQTSLGFLLTGFTIWLAFRLEASAGWPLAFGVLAVGPAVGILSMLRLRRARVNT